MEEGVPTRITVEIRQECIYTQTEQTGVVLPACALQPFEGVILVVPITVNLGDLIGSSFAVFCD